MFSSIAQAPAKQSVSETITVLSGRLNSATLLEDRRAAILGLRSFAKEYPASVASGALRSLIGSLSSDGEDVDTVKVVLETLLMLFSPNQDSPEASEEIALWLADEFTQRQENIALLIDFLESADFYSRLYPLQLLLAILAARTERTEECILAATGGISKLVALLDDRREAVRNEALTLLTFLTPSSPVIQKIVAFENAFERVFAIIEAEGSLTEGDRIVEDCLILLANLLRINPSNQSLFRESGCVPRLAKLLEGTYYTGTKDEEEVAGWAQEQRNRNIYALLAVIRLFLGSGAEGTVKNQTVFWQHGVLYHALQLAFSHKMDIAIKAEALATCADTIRDNARLQEGFASLQVPSVSEPPPATNGKSSKSNGIQSIYVIDGLLDLVLSVSSLQAFDLRLAACQCVKAYFSNHSEIRSHFLHRAIDGHSSGADETANVLTTLLQPLDAAASVDPYRYWFATVITFHLLFENPDGKALVMALTEGDAESGEEVVTSIQTITANLISGLGRGDDERIVLGYLMLLIGWLFEDLDGVNDLLGEGSNITALAEAVIRYPPHSNLVQGLSAMLLGVIYEFSTKDSPISRATLHTVLLKKMSRDRYIDTLNKLRSQPAIREFEVLPQKLDGSGELPEVFFDETFVAFFKDNFSRLVKAFDREPGMEISVMRKGVEQGVSRELVDALRAQLTEKERVVQEARDENMSLNTKLTQEQVETRKAHHAANNELSRIKSVNEAMQRSHEQEIKQLEARQNKASEEHKRLLDAVRREAAAAAELTRKENGTKEAELQRQLDYIRKISDSEKERASRKFDSEKSDLKAAIKRLEASENDLKATISRLETSATEATRAQRRTEAEMADLRATISRLEVDIMKANKAKTQEVQAVREELSATLAAKEAEVKEEQMKVKNAEERHRDLQEQLSQGEDALKTIQTQLKAREDEKAAKQIELDDILMVLADSEEKVQSYKKRLRDAGETVSDDEDDDGGDDEEEEEDEDDDDDDNDADGVD